MARVPLAALLVAAACGSDSETATPEVVVADASLGGAVPQVLGANATTVFWTATSNATTVRIGGASLASVPATGAELATASGPVVHADDRVVFVADGSIVRVDMGGAVQRITAGTGTEALGAKADPLTVAWTVGPVVSWGAEDSQMTATFTKIDSCDHARVTAQHAWVACDGASGRRLLRVDLQTGDVMPVSASSTWAPMFPGGGTAGATYTGRIVDADDSGALWLVEELPSRRGLLVNHPIQGEGTVLRENIQGASGFFASGDTLYWQEGELLLSAPRAGGPASIVATEIGTAGAVADGFVYFATGAAIERLRVD